ncbi:MAG: hypothetical protein FRX49_01947 [Trebouxia sp. A1-2]|nr:MAG: hypothetical protein FRX49_01947 [Trebouxia sp. A1-2]
MPSFVTIISIPQSAQAYERCVFDSSADILPGGLRRIGRRQDDALLPRLQRLRLVRSAFRLGKWKQDQSKPHAVLVELLFVAAKHTAFQASSRLRADSIRLDEDLTPQQMKQRRNMSVDFQCLKARGHKPFFRGVKLRFRDGAVIRTCAKNEANKVVAAAA